MNSASCLYTSLGSYENIKQNFGACLKIDREDTLTLLTWWCFVMGWCCVHISLFRFGHQSTLFCFNFFSQRKYSTDFWMSSKWRSTIILFLLCNWLEKILEKWLCLDCTRALPGMGNWMRLNWHRRDPYTSSTQCDDDGPPFNLQTSTQLKQQQTTGPEWVVPPIRFVLYLL